MSSEYEGYDEWVRSAIRKVRKQEAAEDMYEALRMLLTEAVVTDMCDPANKWGFEAICKARAALRKAEGEAR